MIEKLLYTVIIVFTVFVATACKQTSTADRIGVRTAVPVIATDATNTAEAPQRTFTLQVPVPAPSTYAAASSDKRLIPNDPYFALQWGLEAIKAPEAWKITTGDPATVIVILAYGVDLEHRDLKSKFVTPHSKKVVSEDQLRFGTLLAGIVAADTDNSAGIAGTSWGSKVLPFQLDADEAGSTSELSVVQGIEFAGEYARAFSGDIIVVVPFIFPFPSDLMHDVINYAQEREVLVIASFSQGERVSALANEPGVLAVRGLSRIQIREAKIGSAIASTPETGEFVFICAPAEDGAGTYPRSVYEAWRSESLATGYVAGVAALAWSVNPELTVTEMKDLLLTSASDLGPSGYDSQYGAGLLNAEAAIMAALPKTSSSDDDNETR